MNKLYKKLIVFGLGILPILAWGMIIMPQDTKAQYGGYIASISPAPVKQDKPKPVINSITPKSSNIGTGTKTVTITGEGFVPSSVVRINGANRSTTFIDNSHLLIQITGDDTYKYLSNGGFFITVWNDAPGGGHSNTAFFAVNKTTPATSTTRNTQNNQSNETSNNFTNFNDTLSGDNQSDENISNLASNAIFGANGPYPSGVIQWVFFAIMILLIVILVRKVFGGSARYHATPLKHD